MTSPKKTTTKKPKARKTPGKVIKDFLNTYGGKGGVVIPPVVMDEYLKGCRKALEQLFEPSYTRKPGRLYVTDLGKPVETIVELLQGRKPPELKGDGTEKVMKYKNFLTFWRGKVCEEVLIAILRTATPTQIKDEQKRIEFVAGGVTVSGKMDFVFDEAPTGGPEEIWDAKTANDRSFKEKFKNTTTLAEQDYYNYYPQGMSYERADGRKFGGFLLMNPNDCCIKDLLLDDTGRMFMQSRFEAAVEKVQTAAEEVAYLEDNKNDSDSDKRGVAEA